MTIRSILLAAATLVGATVVAVAQQPYPTPYPNNQVSAAPSAWSYDPYTSGLGPCVQANWGNSPPCSETIQPTYGQPNYWPNH